MGAQVNINETLELLKTARTQPNDDIAKAFTQSGTATTGLTAYDLEAPAKTIYPVLTPLRNRIARVSGRGGIQAAWKAITGININNLSVGLAEGKRGGVIATTVTDYLAAYRGIGLDDYATFEADMAAEYYDNAKARTVQGLLRSLMIGEEMVLVGGNTSVPLGTTPTPTLVSAITGGTIATGTTWSVICVALGPDAYWAVAGQNNGGTGQSFNAATATVPASVTRSNGGADASDTYGGGSAQKSASATTTIASGSNGSIACTVAVVSGAAGYAWYFGAVGSEKLVGISTINSFVVTAAAAGGAQTAASLPSSDNSTNSLIFDGLLTQIYKSGSGAYVKSLATGTAGVGTTLSSNGGGGITELDNAFSSFWNSYRLSPDTIYVNAQELKNITTKVVNNGGAPLIKLNANAQNPGLIQAGVKVGTVMNMITGDMVDLIVHANIAPGTILFYTSELPYKISGVDNILQVRCRRDYYQIEWPLRTRKWEYGVYADEVLQNYFPPAYGVINNIANG